MAHLGQVGAQAVQFRVVQEADAVRGLESVGEVGLQADEGIGGDELGFEVRQGQHAVVPRRVRGRPLVADQGDEGAELDDL